VQPDFRESLGELGRSGDMDSSMAAVLRYQRKWQLRVLHRLLSNYYVVGDGSVLHWLASY
jgi:hypothetical protein